MYKLVRVITHTFTKVFFPFRRINHKQAVQNPCVIVSNHLSNCDAFIVGSIYNHKIYALTKKELFKGKGVSWFLRTLGGIPIDRDTPDASTILRCVRLLKGGDKLLIFPEGTRNKTGEKLLPLKSGAALFAIKAKVPIQPVFIDRPSKFLRLNHVIVGEAFSLEQYYNLPLTPEVLAEADALIKDSLLKTSEISVR